ncbi:MAG: hypothetical protein ACI39G_05630 [Pseudoramibacter sp.]
MLGKLMKYEFKETWLPMVIAFGLLCILGGIGAIAMHVSPQAAVSEIFTVLYVIALIVVAVLVLVWIVKRFYDNLLSKQGYLTMTLPANAWEQVGAKLLTGLIWMIALMAVMMISISFFFVGSETFSFSKMTSAEWDTLWQMFHQYHVGTLMFEVFLSVVVGAATSLLTFYFAMAVGQLVNRHRKLLSVGVWIAIFIVIQVLGIQFILMWGKLSADWAMSQNLLNVGSYIVISTVVEAIIGALLYIGTAWLLDRHLNLE